MTTLTYCRFCGQRLPHKKSGVELPPLKARIFDMLKSAGPEGVPNDHLIVLCKIGGLPERRLRTLNVHVNQMNAMLAPAGWAIVGKDWRKYLVKRKKKGLAKRVKS